MGRLTVAVRPRTGLDPVVGDTARVVAPGVQYRRGVEADGAGSGKSRSSPSSPSSRRCWSRRRGSPGSPRRSGQWRRGCPSLSDPQQARASETRIAHTVRLGAADRLERTAGGVDWPNVFAPAQARVPSVRIPQVLLCPVVTTRRCRPEASARSPAREGAVGADRAAVVERGAERDERPRRRARDPADVGPPARELRVGPDRAGEHDAAGEGAEVPGRRDRLSVRVPPPAGQRSVGTQAAARDPAGPDRGERPRGRAGLAERVEPQHASVPSARIAQLLSPPESIAVASVAGGYARAGARRRLPGRRRRSAGGSPAIHQRLLRSVIALPPWRRGHTRPGSDRIR